MFSTVLSATVRGLCVDFVQVEADVSNGLPMFHLVGYLSSEVKEAGERVRTAIRNSGFILPTKKIVVNLSPADIKKKGTIFDLAIAMAVLTAMEEVVESNIADTVFVGELSLDGRLKGIRGTLPIVSAAKERGYFRCVVPKQNQKEAELISGIQIVGANNLQEVYEYIKRGTRNAEEKEEKEIFVKESVYEDFADVRGQIFAKRAVEIAVAGGHNLLMVGPPGVGKTAIAKRIPSILPPLSRAESIELTTICSIAGEVDESNPLISTRPFREVHSSITRSGLLGGGIYPSPGEISLAHKGVLFLDEIAEFPRSVLESLRKPLEEHKIKIVREKGEYVFPAEFLLVAAMNPCTCGNYPDLEKCTCTTAQRSAYFGKLSQPFLERMDLCIDVPKMQYAHLTEESEAEKSETIRERVMRARKIQESRFQGLQMQTNAGMGMKEIERYCELSDEGERLMRQAYERLGLSARTYHKVLTVARTIADLAGEKSISIQHLQEALGYRMIDANYGR